MCLICRHSERGGGAQRGAPTVAADPSWTRIVPGLLAADDSGASHRFRLGCLPDQAAEYPPSVPRLSSVAVRRECVWPVMEVVLASHSVACRAMPGSGEAPHEVSGGHLGQRNRRPCTVIGRKTNAAAPASSGDTASRCNMHPRWFPEDSRPSAEGLFEPHPTGTAAACLGFPSVHNGDRQDPPCGSASRMPVTLLASARPIRPGRTIQQVAIPAAHCAAGTMELPPECLAATSSQSVRKTMRAWPVASVADTSHHLQRLSRGQRACGQWIAHMICGDHLAHRARPGFLPVTREIVWAKRRGNVPTAEIHGGYGGFRNDAESRIGADSNTAFAGMFFLVLLCLSTLLLWGCSSPGITHVPDVLFSSRCQRSSADANEWLMGRVSVDSDERSWVELIGSMLFNSSDAEMRSAPRMTVLIPDLSPRAVPRYSMWNNEQMLGYFHGVRNDKGREEWEYSLVEWIPSAGLDMARDSRRIDVIRRFALVSGFGVVSVSGGDCIIVGPRELLYPDGHRQRRIYRLPKIRKWFDDWFVDEKLCSWSLGCALDNESGIIVLIGIPEELASFEHILRAIGAEQVDVARPPLDEVYCR